MTLDCGQLVRLCRCLQVDPFCRPFGCHGAAVCFRSERPATTRILGSVHEAYQSAEVSSNSLGSLSRLKREVDWPVNPKAYYSRHTPAPIWGPEIIFQRYHLSCTETVLQQVYQRGILINWADLLYGQSVPTTSSYCIASESLCPYTYRVCIDI